MRDRVVVHTSSPPAVTTGLGSLGPLSHVLWLGGSTFSGKSTVAAILARRYGLEVYSCDDELPRHMQAALLDDQPTLHLFGRMVDLPLLLLPPDLLAVSLGAMAKEQLGMIVEEFLSSGTPRPLVVEGAAVLPASIGPALKGQSRAVWLISTETFLRTNYRRARERLVEGTLKGYSDPERAFRGWMDRDLSFAEIVRSQVEELGLDAVEVDGTRSPDDIADEVAERFRLGRDGTRVV